MQKPRLNPQFGLFFVALLWGTSFPVIRIALQSVAAPTFVATRFSLAGIVFLSVLAVPAVRREVFRIWLPGLGIGALNFVIFTTQTMAMQTISGPRAAFLTGTYVVTVPMLSRVFGRPSPVLLDWVSAGIAFVGLTILASPFTDGHFTGFRVGDVFALACAATVSIKIHSLTRLAETGAGAMAIAFHQIWGVVLLYLLFWPLLPATGDATEWTWPALLCVFYCAWGITLGSFYLQSRYQRFVPPQKSSLIYCLEPVFATFFSFLFTGERLEPSGLVGGAFILSAQLLSPLLSQSRRAIQRMAAMRKKTT